MLHSGMRPKKKRKRTHLSQTVVLPLLATTLGAAEREKERRMRNHWYSKYT